MKTSNYEALVHWHGRAFVCEREGGEREIKLNCVIRKFRELIFRQIKFNPSESGSEREREGGRTQERFIK